MNYQERIVSEIRLNIPAKPKALALCKLKKKEKNSTDSVPHLRMFALNSSNTQNLFKLL